MFPTRYPSSAIAPNLQYIINNDGFSETPTTSPIHGKGKSHNKIYPNATEGNISDANDDSVKYTSEIKTPSQKIETSSISTDLNNETKQFKVKNITGSEVFNSKHVLNNNCSIHDDLTPQSGKDRESKETSKLNSKLLSNVHSSQNPAFDLKSLASNFPLSECHLPHVYKQLQQLSSIFPSQHIKNARSTTYYDRKNPLDRSHILDQNETSIDSCIKTNLVVSSLSEAKHDVSLTSGVSESHTFNHLAEEIINHRYPPSSLFDLSSNNALKNIPADSLDTSLPSKPSPSDPLEKPLDVQNYCYTGDNLKSPLNSEAPKRLLLVMRRFPHKIVPILRRRSSVLEHSSLTSINWNTIIDEGGDMDASELLKLEGALTGNSTKQQYDLSMQEAQDVYWTIETNQFGLNIVEAFSEAVHRVVVIDPGIKFSLLSTDADVQRSLRRSLLDFLFEQNIIPVFLEAYEPANCERYTEEVLSPLFHYITPPVSTGYHNLDWAGYRELNIAFLNAIVEHYQEGDWILVFNYQLMLLPKMLRERPITRNASIGFYLSTLFPSSEMYRMLPQREELLRGVLAASFIGFHNFQYKRHFFTACTRVLGVECSGDCIEPDSAVGSGAGARVVMIPRGINCKPWIAELQKPLNRARISELRERLKGRKVLLGIDTLDYTKGIPNKILAFNKFLINHPEWASNVVFYQICVPKRQKGWSQNSIRFSRSVRQSQPHKRDILSTVYQLVGAINASFGNLLHQPIHFLLSPLSVENLVCLYGLADIVVITPLRESLSWTAYEFVLCQSYTNKGVLILSEFSGSAQSLGAAAICVNPWDADALAVAIHDALIMKDEEKLERHQYGVDYVLNYDAQAWGRNLLSEFRQAMRMVETEKKTFPQSFPYAQLLSSNFSLNKKRLLILGLRGTLYPSCYQGMDPQITRRIRLSRIVEATLNVLSQDPNTHIVVISSSPECVLFETLGHLKNITLLAENGHLQRLSKRLQDFRNSTDSRRNSATTPQETLAFVTQTSNLLSRTGSLKTQCVDDGQNEFECGNSFEYTASDVDLSWMDPVLESCLYFEQRTPGSFLVRTATSITWNYHGAQREHGTRQARDLLIHLWARPAAVAARTDIVLGPHSVEIRSAATSKAAAIEQWLNLVLLFCGKTDLSDYTILCAANFLSCDEAVYNVITKVFQNKLQENTSPDKTTSAIPNVNSHSHFEFDGQKKNLDALINECSKKPQDGNSSEKNNINNNVEASYNIWICTVGVKPSRAEYFIEDNKEVEKVLTFLGALMLHESITANKALIPLDTDDMKEKDKVTNLSRVPLLEDSQYNKHTNYERMAGCNMRAFFFQKNRRSTIFKCIDKSTLQGNPDIQKALVLYFHHNILSSHINTGNTGQDSAGLSSSELVARTKSWSGVNKNFNQCSLPFRKVHNNDFVMSKHGNQNSIHANLHRFNSTPTQPNVNNTYTSLRYPSDDSDYSIPDQAEDELFSETSTDDENESQYLDEDQLSKQETFEAASGLRDLEYTLTSNSPCSPLYSKSDQF